MEKHTSKKWITSQLLGAILLSSLLLVNTGLSYAESVPASLDVTVDTAVTDRLTDDEISGFGCLIGTVSAFTAGYWAGPSEAIMLWGGGLLTPSNSAVLAVSILGGLGYAGCSFGSTISPTLAWVYERMGIPALISSKPNAK